MYRRSFLVLSTATLATIPFGLSAAPYAYQPGLVSERLAAGETVFLDFKASWCVTCRAQGRVLKSLKADNPDYEEAITFIDVDWDKWNQSDIVRQYNVPRRSTLIVLKGDQEIGRIVAGTSRGQIKQLMDAALSVA